MACLLGSAACLAQSSPTGERKGVRRGNRDFRKEQWQDAEINYGDGEDKVRVVDGFP